MLRLLKRRDFQRLNQGATRRVGKYILVDVCSNRLSHTRLGITITRKFGNSPERNRFKRIVREAFRLCRHQLPPSLDLVVRPRSLAESATMMNIMQDLLHLLPLPPHQ